MRRKVTNAQANAIIKCHAPKWREHLADPHVLEHIVNAVAFNKTRRRKKKRVS